MKKIAIFLIIFCVCGVSLSGTLDWKRLHEEADIRSLAEIEASLKGNPNSLERLYTLGLSYLNLYNDIEAEKVFNRILILYPDTLEAQWGIAEVERRGHRIEKSERLLEAILAREPDFSPALISLAYLRYTQMNFKESVELAYKVVKQGRDKVDISNYARAYLLVAGARGMLAHYGGPLSKVANGTAVLPNLKKAEALQPDSPAVLFGLGSFYFLAPVLVGGNRGKAQEYLERAVQVDPLFADAYVRLAQLYKMKGDIDKYNQCLEKARQIDPQNTLLLDMQNKECKFICVSLEK